MTEKKININFTHKPNSFDLLPEEIKVEGLHIIKKNLHNHYELRQLLNTDAEVFKYVPISDINLSKRVISALTRHDHISGISYDTVGKILCATISELNRIRGLGFIGLSELLVMIKQYIEQKNYNLHLRNIYDLNNLNQQRLGHALMFLIDNKDYNDISYSDAELSIIEKYKEALTILDPELYSSALDRKQPIRDIIEAIYAFSEPRTLLYSYINELYRKIHCLPKHVIHSPLQSILAFYYMTEKKIRCKFLLNLDIRIKLFELPKYITTAEFRDKDTIYTINDLFNWLKFDFDIMCEDILKPLNS